MKKFAKASPYLPLKLGESPQQPISEQKPAAVPAFILFGSELLTLKFADLQPLVIRWILACRAVEFWTPLKKSSNKKI
jgi:hypothetical protein